MGSSINLGNVSAEYIICHYVKKPDTPLAVFLPGFLTALLFLNYVTCGATHCNHLLPLKDTKCLHIFLQVGYYMVMERREKFPKVVFCDFTKLPEEAGFQRTFGSPGNLRHFVAFDAALG